MTAVEGFAICSNPACDVGGQAVPAAIELDEAVRQAAGAGWPENSSTEIRFVDDEDYICPECKGWRVPVREEPPTYARANL